MARSSLSLIMPDSTLRNIHNPKYPLSGVHSRPSLKDIGGQVLTTTGVENYMCYQYIKGFELMQKFEDQVKQFLLEQKLGQGVAGLSSLDAGFEVTIDNVESHQAKAVIVATGKRPRTLNVPGEEQLKGRV